ncbi:uncharacterized protein BJ212DRAFT_1371616, partial [Suillus subaureus]
MFALISCELETTLIYFKKAIVLLATSGVFVSVRASSLAPYCLLFISLTPQLVPELILRQLHCRFKLSCAQQGQVRNIVQCSHPSHPGRSYKPIQMRSRVNTISL